MKIVNYEDDFSIKEPGVISIFLAGPSKRSTSNLVDWREEAVEIFKKYNYVGRLFLPRTKESDDSIYDNGYPEWELHHLDLADAIMFWVPRKFPETKGLVTNVEFGMAAGKYPEKVVYGRPNDAEDVSYLDYIHANYSFRFPETTLENAVMVAIHRAKSLAY